MPRIDDISCMGISRFFSKTIFFGVAGMLVSNSGFSLLPGDPKNPAPIILPENRDLSGVESVADLNAILEIPKLGPNGLPDDSTRSRVLFSTEEILSERPLPPPPKTATPPPIPKKKPTAPESTQAGTQVDSTNTNLAALDRTKENMTVIDNNINTARTHIGSWLNFAKLDAAEALRKGEATPQIFQHDTKLISNISTQIKKDEDKPIKKELLKSAKIEDVQKDLEIVGKLHEIKLKEKKKSFEFQQTFNQLAQMVSATMANEQGLGAEEKNEKNLLQSEISESTLKNNPDETAVAFKDSGLSKSKPSAAEKDGKNTEDKKNVAAKKVLQDALRRRLASLAAKEVLDSLPENFSGNLGASSPDPKIKNNSTSPSMFAEILAENGSTAAEESFKLSGAETDKIVGEQVSELMSSANFSQMSGVLQENSASIFERVNNFYRQCSSKPSCLKI